MDSLSQDWMQINVAEYIALLITCETFAEFCRGKITDCELDNTSAQGDYSGRSALVM